MNCPACNVQLKMAERQGVEINYCPDCRSVRIDRGGLEKSSIALAGTPQLRALVNANGSTMSTIATTLFMVIVGSLSCPSSSIERAGMHAAQAHNCFGWYEAISPEAVPFGTP
jgi:hypothetical protein